MIKLRKNDKKILTIFLATVIIIAIAFTTWKITNKNGKETMLVSGNGRIEATEIDIATKFPGRIVDIFVREGDFVKAGQLVAQMQSNILEAQLTEAHAQHQEAIHAVASAEAQVAMRASDVVAAQAMVSQRQSQYNNAKGRLARTTVLTKKGTATKQKLDDDTTNAQSLEAALKVANAQVKAALAAVKAAKAAVTGAQFKVKAIKATIARIELDLADSQLKAPLDGRVQYRVAEPGEVLGAGGKVLNMVNLEDVYMTFFLPETIVGRVALDNEARIILDALPNYVLPARVSFVSSVAQFTPKSVETAIERQKLMFKVKVRIDPNLLKKHIKQVKTGLPGMAWLKLDPQTEWPQELIVRVPE